jgi:hypothetical protein
MHVDSILQRIVESGKTSRAMCIDSIVYTFYRIYVAKIDSPARRDLGC